MAALIPGGVESPAIVVEWDRAATRAAPAQQTRAKYARKNAWIRSTDGNAARRIAAWLGWYEGLQRLRSIAAALRLSSSGRVSDLVRQCDRMLHRNPALQAKVDLAYAALA